MNTPSLPHDIYLDNNATTPVLPEVAEAMARVATLGALNPSSAHSGGERARRLLAEARSRVAALLGASPDELVFTSGATEGNHLVLRMLFRSEFDGFRVLYSATEHSSIRSGAEALKRAGLDVQELPVDENGQVSPADVSARMVPGRAFVFVQWANNETGVIQSVEELSAICRSAGAWFHTDAVQAVGKLPVDLSRVPVDSLALSGHKFHGPQGVGALFVRRSRSVRPDLPAGDQEWGVRPGTHNMMAIVGLGLAATIREERLASTLRHLESLRDGFEDGLRERGLIRGVNGSGARRLPNTANVQFARVDGEALMARLDAAGILCSQSSACTAMRPEPSYVLRAMGMTEAEAFRSVRFSFSEMNTTSEVAAALDRIQAAVTHLNRIPLSAHLV